MVCRLLNAALALDSLCLISVFAPPSVVTVLSREEKWHRYGCGEEDRDSESQLYM